MEKTQKGSGLEIERAGPDSFEKSGDLQIVGWSDGSDLKLKYRNLVVIKNQ